MSAEMAEVLKDHCFNKGISVQPSVFFEDEGTLRELNLATWGMSACDTLVSNAVLSKGVRCSVAASVTA